MHLLCLSDDARSRCCTTPLVVRGVSTKSESPQSYAALEVSTHRRIGAPRLQQHSVSLTRGNVGIVFVAEAGTCTSLAGMSFPPQGAVLSANGICEPEKPCRPVGTNLRSRTKEGRHGRPLMYPGLGERIQVPIIRESAKCGIVRVSFTFLPMNIGPAASIRTAMHIRTSLERV